MANKFQQAGGIAQICFRHSEHGQPNFKTFRFDSTFVAVHLDHERGQAYDPLWETLDLEPLMKSRFVRPTRAEMDELAGELLEKLVALQTSNPQSAVKANRANALVFLQKWCILFGGYHLYVRTGEGAFQSLLPPVGSRMTPEQREGFKVHPSIERISYDTRVYCRGGLIFHTPAECVYDFDDMDEVIAATAPLHDRPEWENMSRLPMDSAELAGQILLALRDDGLEQGTDHAVVLWRNPRRMNRTETQVADGKATIIPAGEGPGQKIDPNTVPTGELRVLWGPHIDEVYWLFASTTIGRSKDCDIAFEDDTISRRHLKITKTDEGHVLEDLNSTGGVFVHDEKKQRHVLKDFDRLRIGSILLEYRKGTFTMVDRHLRLHDKQPIVNALDREVGRIARQEQKLCVVLVDLDHFKRFNDNEGFPAGDAILIHVEGIGRMAARSQDTFARIGGEEFGFVLPGMDLDAGLAFAEQLRAMVEKSKCFYGGRSLGITISCGVAEWASDTEPPWSLYRRADRQLLQARRTGAIACVEGRNFVFRLSSCLSSN